MLIFILALLPILSLAAPAELYPIADSDTETTTVTVYFKNINAAKKFKFELWDKRVGRTNYRKVDVFFKKRTNKKKTKLNVVLENLKSDRDYRIRYRPVYSGDRLGVWSDYELFHTKKKAVTFNLTVTDDFPTTDTPYVIIQDRGTFPMTATGELSWTYELEDMTVGDILHFIFSRNNLGTGSYEALLSLDDPEAVREYIVDYLPETRDIEVTSWRWYDSSLSSGEISSQAWSIAPRSQFIITAGLPTYYQNEFEPLVASTMEAIAASGFQYVTIYHSPRLITAGDPTVAEKIYTNTMTPEELTTIVSAAKTAGLSPILAIQMNIDPDNQAAINEELAGEHDDTFYETYLTRWKTTMSDGIERAIENDIAIVVLLNPFEDFSYQDIQQEALVNSNIEGLLPQITEGYDGMVTTNHFHEDEQFTWYDSAEIDWIGDDWTPDVTAVTTPTIDDMYADALADIISRYDAAFATYGKPIYLHQLIVYGWDGAAGAVDISPTSDQVDPELADDTTVTRDYQEQADAYEAVWRAIADTDYIIGAGSTDFYYHIQHDKLAGIRNRPAEQVWTRWIGLFNE